MFAKKPINNIRALMVILVLLTLLGSQVISMAQVPSATPTAQTFELVGLIEASTSTSLTINNSLIDITNAEIKVAVTVGTSVKVEGSVSADGSLTAREVKRPNTTGVLDGEIEVIGELTAINGSTMTIAGQDFNVRNAEIKAGAVINQIVKVHASLVDGVWVAREVEPTIPDNNLDNTNLGEFELTGTLTDLTSSTAIISGQTIDISQAEVKDVLVVGALVKVHYSIVDRQLVAREIELSSNNGAGGDSVGQGSDDNSNHDLNDDHGQDNGNHDVGDDNGGQGNGDDHGGNNNGNEDNSGQGGDNGGSDHGGSGHG